MKITDFKVVCICPDHNEKYHSRKLHMERLLDKIGFKNVEHYKSGTENYPDCLSIATIDILEKNLDEPILIIEDDVEWNGIDEIDFDPECDAIYLGISKSGGHPLINLHLGESKFEKWNETQVRVINMLTTHAILYNSKKYKLAVIDILKRNMNKKYYNDVLISRIQNEYLILAPIKPLFYQSAKFNIQFLEDHTNFVIKIKE
jgi:hypothetical protein